MKSETKYAKKTCYLRLIDARRSISICYFSLNIFFILNIYLHQILARQTCLTQEVEKAVIQDDPGYRDQRQNVENNIQKYLKFKNSKDNGVAAGIAIPAVFHFIHNRYAIKVSDNISDTLLLARFDHLNSDYVRTYWDDTLKNTTAFSWTLQYQMPAGVSGCTDHTAPNLPQDIPDDNTTGLTSIINVSSGGTVEGIEIKNLNGTHTWVGDLKFTLISPMGTSVVLIENKCSNMDDFNIGLSDNTVNDITCPINDSVTEKPENALSAFNGENAAGDWKLVVVDNATNDTGALNGWTLQICTQGSGDCPSTTIVDDTPIAEGVYQAGTQLTSMGTIDPASDVLFRAGNNVELKSNFIVAANASFEVRIEGCQ